MLTIKPCELKDANAFVEEHHRHNKSVTVHKFSVKCIDDGRMCGVAIVGRPSSRMMDDNDTLQIHRVCTDGTANACTKLYGACCRIAKEMGYRRIITYTLETEPGTSLKASNWKKDGEAGGGSWDRPTRKRTVSQMTLFGEVKKYSTEKKTRWTKILQ